MNQPRNLPAAWSGACLVLTAALAWAQNPRPGDGPPELGQGLDALQQQLAGLAIEAAKAVTKAQEVPDLVKKLKEEQKAANKNLNEAKAPPSPLATPQDLLLRQTRIRAAETTVKKLKEEEKALGQRIVTAQESLRALRQFQEKNKDVRLPEGHPLVPWLRSHRITLEGNRALEDLENILRDPRFWDGARPLPAVPLAPDRSREPLPPRNPPQQQFEEGAAIQKEKIRLAEWRQGLGTRTATLVAEIHAHNKNPDKGDPQKKVSYEAKSAELKTRQANLLKEFEKLKGAEKQLKEREERLQQRRPMVKSVPAARGSAVALALRERCWLSPV